MAQPRERVEKAHLEIAGADGARASSTKGNFKKISGGYYDVEYILAFLFLTRVLPGSVETGSAPRAESRGHVLRQIAALESAGTEASGLTTAQAQILRAAALLYRSLDHALRLVTGRPSNQLPEPALAERVTRLLQGWRLPLPEGLEPAVESARHQIPALYEQIVLAALPLPMPQAGRQHHTLRLFHAHGHLRRQPGHR